MSEVKVVNAGREIAAPAERIFALIADPSQQPRWDGNDNLAGADAGQRVRAVGGVFAMTLTLRCRPGEPRGGVRGGAPYRLASGRARVTTAERLRASLDRLAELAERP